MRRLPYWRAVNPQAAKRSYRTGPRLAVSHLLHLGAFLRFPAPWKRTTRHCRDRIGLAVALFTKWIGPKPTLSPRGQSGEGTWREEWLTGACPSPRLQTPFYERADLRPNFPQGN